MHILRSSRRLVAFSIIVAFVVGMVMSAQPSMIQAASVPEVLKRIALTVRPMEIAVNPVTNTVYVLGTQLDVSDPTVSLTIIDGSDQEVEKIVMLGAGYDDIVVNPTNNKVYITNGWDFVSVRDGATGDEIASVPTLVGTGGARTIGVNPATNRIYLARDHNSINVLDSTSDTIVATVSGLGPYTYIVAVNPVTNKLYICYQSDNGFDNLKVLDISQPQPTVIKDIPIQRDSDFKGVVNELTNTIYIANVSETNSTVDVLDGESDEIIATLQYDNGVYDPVNKTYTSVQISGIVVDQNTNHFFVPTVTYISSATTGYLTSLKKELTVRSGSGSSNYGIIATLGEYLNNDQQTWRQRMAYNQATGRAYVIDLAYGNYPPLPEVVVVQAETSSSPPPPTPVHTPTPTPTSIPTTVPMYSISGTIKDVYGIPVYGATISVGTAGSTTTTANGYYELWLPPGNYSITPSLEGYDFNPYYVPVTLPQQTGVYDFKATYRENRIAYFALGDSVASGHGLQDKGEKVDPCRRGQYSYPRIVESELKKRYDEVQFFHFACSGASASNPGSRAVRLSNDKWLSNQVDRVTANISDHPTLVSITIGANDFGWADPEQFAQHMCWDTNEQFNTYVNERSASVRENLNQQVNRLLNANSKVKVVLTDYHNPFNQQSIFFRWSVDSESDCILANAYARSEKAAHSLNDAIASIFYQYTYTDRIGIAYVHNQFHGHESPIKECGSAAPERYDSWIQYPSDENSTSYPKDIAKEIIRDSGVKKWRGDCFHPNILGAAEFAKSIDSVARSLGR